MEAFVPRPLPLLVAAPRALDAVLVGAPSVVQSRMSKIVSVRNDPRRVREMVNVLLLQWPSSPHLKQDPEVPPLTDLRDVGGFPLLGHASIKKSG